MNTYIWTNSYSEEKAKMRKVTVHFNSVLPHFTQLLTGLQYLKDRNLIDLQYRLNIFEFPPYIFKVEVDGRQLFFDMADNSIIHTEIYDRADYYIKRMLLKSDFKRKNKLLPFGLNYGVYYKDNYLKTLFFKDWKFMKYSLRYSKTASKILNIKNGIHTCELSKMHSLPSRGRNIVFRSRLWDPSRNICGTKKEEREIMNRERIELQNSLQRIYENKFRGGIETDPYSKNMARDYLLSKEEYHKKNYLQLLKKSSIGIVNQGLEKSIGWKFGEYISHSLAIITTPINEYQLLGPLKEEEHYFSFKTAEECLKKTDLLFSNDKLRMEMQQANVEYYRQWLHPGQKILKIFELIDL